MIVSGRNQAVAGRGPAHAARVDELASVEFLLSKMQDSKKNVDFFDAMKR